MFAYVVENFSLMLKSIAIGLLISIGLYAIQPPRYDAVVYIEPAIFNGNIVEGVGKLYEQLKMAGFYTDEILKSCGLGINSESRSILLKRVKPRITRNSPLLRIGYSHQSRNVAVACISTIAEKIISETNSGYYKRIDILEKELQDVNSKISSIEYFRKSLEAKIISGSNGYTPAQLGGYLNALNIGNNRWVYLRERRVEMSYILTPPASAPAALAEPVSVGENSYKLSFLMISGLLAGVFGGFVFSIFRLSLVKFYQKIIFLIKIKQ